MNFHMCVCCQCSQIYMKYSSTRACVFASLMRYRKRIFHLLIGSSFIFLGCLLVKIGGNSKHDKFCKRNRPEELLKDLSVNDLKQGQQSSSRFVRDSQVIFLVSYCCLLFAHINDKLCNSFPLE